MDIIRGGVGGYWDIGVAPNLYFHQNVYGAMEVFAVTGSNVPDPSLLPLVLGGGVLVVPAWRRRYRARCSGKLNSLK